MEILILKFPTAALGIRGWPSNPLGNQLFVWGLLQKHVSIIIQFSAAGVHIKYLNCFVVVDFSYGIYNHTVVVLA